jgi:hypothetical protein
MKKLIEIYGWYGMAAILLAYALASFSIISSAGLIYQILNGSGALGVMLASLYKKAYQPAALNLIWTLIAVIALINMFAK